jgi:tetratricopeptide (TPR) repeat protein
MNRIPIAAAVLITAILFSGCGSARGPYSDNGSKHRDIARAEQTYQEALKVIDSDVKMAEQLLREAMGYDLYHGPAHNNLGVLLLKQGRLYDAAEEFEWARKLLPGHPEPRVNLAITLARGGKHADAIDAARTALEVRPGNLPAIQALTWIQVDQALTDERTLAQLDVIVTRTVDPLWRSWAEKQRDRLRQAETDQSVLQP